MDLHEGLRLGPPLGVEGGGHHVLPVSFDKTICATTDEVRRNVEATLARKYVRFNEYLAAPHQGVISLVGSGPSLHQHYQELTGDVLACNAAHDFLLRKGITPKFGMMFDADPVCTGFMTPNPEVAYLLASRCHPDVFEQFKDSNVIVWHAMGDKEIEEILEQHNVMEPMINGGGAAVARAMGLAIAMGYTTMHLFGIDGSHTNGQTHVIKSLVPEVTMDIWCHGKWFQTTSWMASQAEDFKILALSFRDAGCKIIVHGHGLIPHIAKVLGFEVIGDVTI